MHDRMMAQLPRNDHHRALPKIAARLLYKKDAEERALAEIDKFAAGIERRVRIRFITCATTIFLCALFLFSGLSVWVIAEANGRNLAYQPMIVILPFAIIGAGAALYWRHFQYGLGLVRQKRTAFYGKGRASTIETLEKLFDHLGQRAGTRAYYYDKAGIQRDVDRQHFFGRLRGLLLSEEKGDRALVMPPGGFWFTAQIYVDAEPEEIIKTLEVKPQAGGRPKEYNYEAMLLTVLEHPRLKAIKPGEYGSETKVMNLIRERCDASDDHDTDISVPEATELRKFAKRIIAAIKNNTA